MKDDEPTADELREAEALAQALEGRASEAPPDALAAAGLLRYAQSQPGAELDPARAQALGARLRTERTERRRRRRGAFWLWLLAPMAAAAAGVVVLRFDRAARPVPRAARAGSRSGSPGPPGG